MDIATLIGPDAVANDFLRFAILHSAFGTRSAPAPKYLVAWNAIFWLESGVWWVHILCTLDRSWLRLLGRQMCCKCRRVRVSQLFNPDWANTAWADEHKAIRDDRRPNALQPPCLHWYREHFYCYDCSDGTREKDERQLLRALPSRVPCAGLTGFGGFCGEPMVSNEIGIDTCTSCSVGRGTSNSAGSTENVPMDIAGRGEAVSG